MIQANMAKSWAQKQVGKNTKVSKIIQGLTYENWEDQIINTATNISN